MILFLIRANSRSFAVHGVEYSWQFETNLIRNYLTLPGRMNIASP
jgi:hypothetical protein